MPVVLSSELIEFIESGVSILLGTRDAQLRPHAMRGFGASVDPDGKHVTIYLAEAVSSETLSDLRDNGQLSVTFSRPIDHRTIQLKGVVRAITETTAAQRALQERYLVAFIEQVYVVGLPRSLGRRLQIFPSVAARFELQQLFVQTPGPGAGRRLDEGA